METAPMRIFALIGLACCALAARADARPGQLDPSFGTGGLVTIPVPGFSVSAVKLVQQPDKKMQVLAGTTQPAGTPVGNIELRRLMPDGQVDTAFGEGGVVRFSKIGPVDTPFDMQRQS